MDGHFKLVADKIVIARGTEAQMIAARNMHFKSKGKLMGATMQIEHDPIDYPFTGKGEPNLGLAPRK